MRRAAVVRARKWWRRAAPKPRRGVEEAARRRCRMGNGCMYEQANRQW
jgi:hypothetical protein